MIRRYKLIRKSQNIFILALAILSFFLLSQLLKNKTYSINPNEMKVHFIDVGQGDSTLIVTPKNKTILIDGGGSSSSDFDVGENTLVPYILDRGFTKIDFIIISHFDSDHVRTDYYM